MFDGKKKKKRLDASLLSFFNFVPGAIPTSVNSSIIKHGAISEIEKTPQGKEYMAIGRAWLEYTGVPAMLGGGLGAFGINAGLQASQVRTGTSMFSAARFGFGLALILEASIGAAMIATVLTILDPDDLHASGLTNEPIGKTLYDNSPSKQIEKLEHVPSGWKHIWLSGQ